MVKVHPTAIVHPKAELADSVEVGPFCVVGEHAIIGRGSYLISHVVIDGRTTLGENNQIHPFTVLGGVPQDKKYSNEPTQLEIGDGNTIRESCTLSLGTAQAEGVTRVGNNNWIMAYVHIAHDCQVGNNTIFANNATLAGHVMVEDWAILGGFTGVHQFCRIGEHSFCGVGTVLLQDLPPFITAAGNPATPRSINSEGLKRRGFGAETLLKIKKAYKTLYRSGLTLEEAKHKIGELVASDSAIAPLLRFIDTPGRGIIR